jgi:hypothetical protein
MFCITAKWPPFGRYGSNASVERARHVGFTPDSGRMATTQLNDASGQSETFQSHTPVGRSSLDFRPREFSGVQLDEVIHADRLLACKFEQVVGHAVVAALLV